MDLKICSKCNKRKAVKFKKKVDKHLKKKGCSGVKTGLSGCLGACKSLTIKDTKNKKVSKVKLKDAKKIANSMV